MRNRFFLSSVSVAALLALSACSYIPTWMGGDARDEKNKLPGERITVLPVNESLKPDDGVQKVSFAIPAAAENADWPQHSSPTTAATGNLAAKGNFNDVSHTRAGDGNSFATTRVPAPVVADGTVFTMDGVGNISAADAASIGTQRWKNAGVSETDTPDILGGGLAYDAGKLYAISGRGVVAAFDAKTGTQLWKKALHTPMRSAPRVLGDKLFIISADNELSALSTATGDVVWNHHGINETAGLMNAVSPVAVPGAVVAPYSSGELYVLADGSGNEIWHDSLAQNMLTGDASSPFSGIGGDPVIDGQVVFGVSSSGILSAYGLPQGQHLWARPVSSNNTPWLAGDYLFVLSVDNVLACFVKFDGRVRWATQLDSYADEKHKKPIIWSGPVLVDGKLAIAGSNGKLLMVNAADGKIAETKSIEEKIFTAPVVAGGGMYLVSQDATLYELH